MNKIISSASLSGTIGIIPSKSASHRAVMMAALAKGEIQLAPIQLSRDIAATLSCAHALGLLAEAVDIRFDKRRVQESLRDPHVLPGFGWMRLGGGLHSLTAPQLRTLDCGESGSTLRFFIPLALDGRGPVRFIGHGRLMQRPLDIYEQLFVPRGIAWKLDGDTLTVDGQLTPGEFALRGDVSSQFITGLLLALPQLPGDSVIRITTQLESRAYIELTRRIQAAFGVISHWEDEHTLRIPGNQTPISPNSFAIESDWSHAAFYLVAGAIGSAGPLTLTGLDMNSTQGDRAIVDILRQMGADIREADAKLTVHPSTLRGATIDVQQVPDLVPALAVAMAAAEGESRITGAARLRIKESDRLTAMANALNACGASVAELPDGLVIQGGKPLHAARIDGCNDHRIVMAMAVASAISTGELTISDAHAVHKSAPQFWAEFASLGGQARDAN